MFLLIKLFIVVMGITSVMKTINEIRKEFYHGLDMVCEGWKASHVIKEDSVDMSDKVFQVKDYLDKHFARATATKSDDDGYPSEVGVVAIVDGNKKVVKTMSDVQLFYLLQDKFKELFGDKEERDNFLKRIIRAWYYGKISKNGIIMD